MISAGANRFGSSEHTNHGSDPIPFQLANGLVVWLIERHDLPVIVFNLVFGIGANHDPIDKRGLATMTAEALDAGAANLSALEIADRLDFLGARLAKRGEHDGTSFFLSTLLSHAPAVLDVFASLFHSPMFPADEFERLRRQRITAIAQQQQQSSFVASSICDRVLYGDEHSYGTDPRGRPGSLKRLTRDDLVQFFEQSFRPRNATIIVVGDATPATLCELLDNRLRPWQPGHISVSTRENHPSSYPQRVFLVDRPGSQQVDIRVGKPALASNTRDFFPALVLNRILGGQFSSRLNMNLREKRGLTYGAWSRFSFRRSAGPFMAGGAFHTEGAGIAVREILAEITALRENGVTTDEIAFAKESLVGGFVLAFETPAQVALAFESVVMYNLPTDYYSTYVPSLMEVREEDVRRIADTYLDPGAMKIVLVGDQSVVRNQVEALQLGEIALTDVEGNVVRQGTG